MVVDDDRVLRHALCKLLEGAGYAVAGVSNGSKALQQLRRKKFDLVLLDIGLPAMDGYEVARRVRQQGCSQEVFLVALTGYGQEEDRRRSRAAGFDMHLVKPVDPEELQELLSERRAAGVVV